MELVWCLFDKKNSFDYKGLLRVFYCKIIKYILKKFLVSFNYMIMVKILDTVSQLFILSYRTNAIKA